MYDESGGVSRENFKDFFCYGTSGLENTDGGISNFGSGLTSASYILSEGNFRVASNRYDDNKETTIMETDFSDVESEEYPDVVEVTETEPSYSCIPNGCTKITFPNAWDSINVSELKYTIGRIYKRFLDNSVETDVQMECYIDGDSVDPIYPYEVSKSPILPPREYPNIELEGYYCDWDTSDETVYVDIEVFMLAGDEPNNLSLFAMWLSEMCRNFSCHSVIQSNCWLICRGLTPRFFTSQKRKCELPRPTQPPQSLP